MFATKALPDGRVFNPRDLVLPDGRVFDDLRLTELQAALVVGLGIGTHEDGKMALRAKYEAALAPAVEKMSNGGKTPRTISQTIARQAAELIGRQASAPLASEAPQIVQPSLISMKV